MAMFTRNQLYGDNGHPRTKTLFCEFGVGPETLFALGPNDKGMINLKQLYVNMCVEDPSEGKFAETVFGDITFWERLKEAPWMERPLKEWRHEADVLRKSFAFERILKEIKEDGPSGYHAAKYLIEEPWKPKTKESKAATTRSTREAASDVTDLAEFIKNRR